LGYGRAEGMWRKLRYERTSGRAEALFRIAFAVVLLLQLLTLRENVVFFYSTDAVWPPAPALAAYYTPALVQAAFWVWLASAVLLLVGAFTRFAAVVCFLSCAYFLELRAPQASHAADWLIPGLAFHLALMSSNRHFALDSRWLPKGQASSSVAAWPARLAQLSAAFFYFTAGTSKLKDAMWHDGRGFFMTFANPALSHFDLTWLATAPVVSPAINYAVMAWECAMPALLLWRRTRLVALLSAVFFLTWIDVTLPVGWFAWFCVANLVVFADVVPWPSAWLKRLPWLAAPAAPTVDTSRPLGANDWKAHAVTAFLVLHLTSFSAMQIAYGFFAAQRLDWGSRVLRLPILSAYGYAIANVRYFALWPTAVFYPIRITYFEAVERDGRRAALQPFDDHGWLRLGWRDSREVRDDVLAMAASNGMSGTAWRRLFAHLGQRHQADSGRCPLQIHAYSVQIWPGSFGTDQRARKAFLQRAQFSCTPEPSVVWVSGAAPDAQGQGVPAPDRDAARRGGTG
jgi:hypothetical protein